MLVQRPATDLARRLDDPIAVDLEGSPGGLVHVVEERVHDAAAEEDDGRGRAAGTRWTAGQHQASRCGATCRSRLLRRLLGHLGRGCQHTHPEPEPPLPGKEAEADRWPEASGPGRRRVARSSRTERHRAPAAPGRRVPEPWKICSRAASSPRPYPTPEGQTGSHPRQPRHASRCSNSAGSWGLISPRSRARISTMRPRGLSPSSPVTR